MLLLPPAVSASPSHPPPSTSPVSHTLLQRHAPTILVPQERNYEVPPCRQKGEAAPQRNFLLLELLPFVLIWSLFERDVSDSRKTCVLALPVLGVGGDLSITLTKWCSTRFSFALLPSKFVLEIYFSVVVESDYFLICSYSLPYHVL